MHQTPYPPRKLTISGHEPALGGDSPRLSGMEPLLGGPRRAEADLARLQALLAATSEAERASILDSVIRLGQAGTYARELILVVPPRARHRIGNWRGTFTVSQRGGAIAALGALGAVEALPVLLDALADSTYQVRQAAEEALTNIVGSLAQDDLRTETVIATLVGALSSPSPGARQVAARILAEMSQAGLPPDLMLGPLLQNGLAAADWWTRREAAWVLGRLGDRRATLRLIAALQDTSAAVRASAAWALGRLDAPVAVPPLAEMVGDDDEVVRAAAVEALGAQAARLPALDERFTLAIDRLAEALEGDVDPSVRQAALDALTAIDAPAARLVLQSVLGGN